MGQAHSQITPLIKRVPLLQPRNLGATFWGQICLGGSPALKSNTWPLLKLSRYMFWANPKTRKIVGCNVGYMYIRTITYNGWNFLVLDIMDFLCQEKRGRHCYTIYGVCHEVTFFEGEVTTEKCVPKAMCNLDVPWNMFILFVRCQYRYHILFCKKSCKENPNHMLTLAQVYRTWIVPSSVLVCGSVLSHNICVFRSAIFISIHPWTWMNGCDNCQENPAGYESHFMDVTVNIVFLELGA